MILSNYAIPYPILGIDGAFSDEVHVSSDLKFEIDKNNYIFKVSLSLNDPEIIRLINDNKARYACEIDCAKTYYRETFLSPDGSFAITIPRTSLVGNTQFFFSVVVIENIIDYKSANFNQRFYAGYKFNLSKGHMLVYFGQQQFNADIKYDELKALGSIMEVKVDNNSSFTYYDFGGDMITIFLPKSEYDNFRKSNNHTLSDITHASIVQCALISAISEYKENCNTLWAQTLKLRVQNDKKLEKFQALGDLSNKEIMEMVSLMLDNPNRRMFSRLNSQMSE